MWQWRLLIPLIGWVALIQGCATTHGLRQPGVAAGGKAPLARAENLTQRQRALVDASCYAGLPLKTSTALGPTELIAREGYVLEHSSVEKIPLWVCENVGTEQLHGHLARRNKFMVDPDLKGPKSLPSDYLGSGFDRGHQAPAGNQTTNRALKDQTFYMSNMAPQLPSLNRGIWKLLEDKTRSWVNRYGHAYEWTGPIFFDPNEDEKITAVGKFKFKTIGKDAVAIPTHFYKIVVVHDHAAWKSIAFVLPNANFTRPYHLEVYITSINWIERHAGITFMPDLPAGARRALKTEASAMWP